MFVFLYNAGKGKGSKGPTPADIISACPHPDRKTKESATDLDGLEGGVDFVHGVRTGRSGGSSDGTFGDRGEVDRPRLIPLGRTRRG